MSERNRLQAHIEKTGRSEDEVAADLSRLLQKDIRGPAVRLWRGKPQAPKAWIDALGLPEAPALDEDQPAVLDDLAPPPGGEEDERGRQTETPPRPLPDSRTAPPPALLTQAARERIASLHVFAGASIATAVDAQGFEADRGVGGGIGAAWKDKANPIADAWIAWAQEGNRFAQSFVRLMGAGGAGGDLALGYASLFGCTAYIMGHMPDNESTRFLFGRYSRYRTVVAAEPAAEPDGQPDDGAASPGTVHTLGVHPG